MSLCSSTQKYPSKGSLAGKSICLENDSIKLNKEMKGNGGVSTSNYGGEAQRTPIKLHKQESS